MGAICPRRGRRLTSFVSLSIQEASDMAADSPLLLFIHTLPYLKLRNHRGGIDNHCTGSDHGAC
jgi:hypothetical protein